MEQHEITENNVMIANYMDTQIRVKADGTDSVCYHKYWENLMPVVLKIISIDSGCFNFDATPSGIFMAHLFDGGNPHRAIHTQSKSSITAVYTAVVKYLKQNHAKQGS